MADKFKGSIRQIPLQIVDVDNGWRETTDRWRQVCEEIQRAKNRFWLFWRMWHEERGHGKEVCDWMASVRAWHNADTKTRGPKPKCPVQACTNELHRDLWRFITSACDGAHGRGLTLAIQIERGDALTRKAVKSAFPRWMHVLTDLGEMPVYSRPQPIPFDKKNGVIVPPVNGGVKWKFQLRLDRIASDNGKNAGSTLDTVTLSTGGRHGRRLRRILEGIRDGKRKFCGSKLVTRDNRWYVHLCYREEKDEKLDVDPSRVAVLRAMRKHPWSLRMAGKTYWILGRGHTVEHTRKKTLWTKATRQESYRWGSESRRGHGRNRGLYPLRLQLDNFKKTFNGQMIAKVLRICEQQGIGKLVYLQPEGGAGRSRFLEWSGSTSRHRDGWTWHDVTARLNQKCEQLGIAFSAKKRGGRGGNGQ